MNEKEHDFSDLKRLLKLKRHEVPPPGFFNNFSDEIVARIQAGESRQAGSVLASLNESVPWLVSMLRVFEARPGVVGGFATSLCLMLLLGVVLAEQSEKAPQSMVTPMAQIGTPETTPALASDSLPGLANNTASAEGGIAISTNASLQPVLFGQPAGSPLFQQVGFAH